MKILHSQPVYVRAYFDYNPMEDGYIPCRDLGLPFSRGDILEIINHDDPNWWQVIISLYHVMSLNIM